MVNEHERVLFGRVGECQIQSCDMKYSWTFSKRPPAPAADLGKMLTNFLNASSGNGERGGGGGGVGIQTGNGLNLLVKMASEGVE